MLKPAINIAIRRYKMDVCINLFYHKSGLWTKTPLSGIFCPSPIFAKGESDCRKTTSSNRRKRGLRPPITPGSSQEGQSDGEIPLSRPERRETEPARCLRLRTSTALLFPAIWRGDRTHVQAELRIRRRNLHSRRLCHL